MSTLHVVSANERTGEYLIEASERTQTGCLRYKRARAEAPASDQQTGRLASSQVPPYLLLYWEKLRHLPDMPGSSASKRRPGQHAMVGEGFHKGKVTRHKNIWVRHVLVQVTLDHTAKILCTT